MKKLTVFLVAILVAALVGGGAFLAGWDIPAPQKKVEKVVPNDRFSR